jgi:hypothetical protein
VLDTLALVVRDAERAILNGVRFAAFGLAQAKLV